MKVRRRLKKFIRKKITVVVIGTLPVWLVGEFQLFPIKGILLCNERNRRLLKRVSKKNQTLWDKFKD